MSAPGRRGKRCRRAAKAWDAHRRLVAPPRPATHLKPWGVGRYPAVNTMTGESVLDLAKLLAAMG